MNEKEDNKKSSYRFLKTDGGKTKSNSIEVPSISLPKGGGAIKGIDEKFSVNAVNGTASFSIPLPFSNARGASPTISLSYNSGSGNGLFGLGWNLSMPSIKRKTDKGLPQYLDSIDSDTFLFTEAEDLVPEFKKEIKPDRTVVFEFDDNGDYVINEKDSPDKYFTIRFYIPRIDGLFARIERWTEKTTGRIKWRVITKDNSTTLFGWTANSIISNPVDPTKIYEWLPEFVFDDKGNCSQYIYKREDGIGLEESLLHNRNRLQNGLITYANLYIDKVLYGNKTPYKKFGDTFPSDSDYMFQTIFDYGTLKPNDSFEVINAWDFRPDAFSDYKAGFEIRTTRLCKRVLLYHHFTGLNEYDGFVKSLNFEYDTSTEQDFTFLKAITSYGYIKKPDGSYSHKKLPPMEFEYQKHDWSDEIQSISSEDIVHAPTGLDEKQYQFTDLFNEGLSGILTEQANGWYYKHNLGDGKFEQAKLVSPKPSFVGLGRQLQLADLDGDGGKQLVSYDTEPKGYFELDDNNEWLGLQSFKALPNIDFGDANTRMLDLNGDGLPEVVISEDSVFTWYASEGRKGYTSAQKTSKPLDEEEGPHIVFADSTQSIYLADMSGDGMTDILRIRNGEVCYWPNLGYGKFGAKVAIDNAPVFDHPDTFNPAYLRLADIDGSGTSDIIYLGKKKFTCWKNLSGNRFSSIPFEIDPFPEVHSQSKITLTDLLGNGVACIVWSSPLSKDAHAPLKYIDLMNSKKPHIMVAYKNNLGKEVSIEYTPSTRFYIEDKLAGKPWVTRLHFPVHCISKTETVDRISGWRFISSYKYHHGYYDHREREFRGFGMVEQTDTEHFENWVKGDVTNIVDKELHQEPVVSKIWFHTGAFMSREKILNQYAHEYWYEEMKRQGISVVHHEIPLPDARIIPAPGISGSIIDNLNTEEWQEALRACKSMLLRSEVFALDAPSVDASAEEIKKQLTPFSVGTNNCVIELLQPKGTNKHAVFVVKESETISYSYERNTDDPRIAHNLNIKLDEYGNVLESAAVVYPRLTADVSLPSETQQEQSKTVIIYTKNQFTNDVLDNDVYRLRLPSEVSTYEVKGVSKSGLFYSVTDFVNILTDAKSSTVEYHDLVKPLIAGKAQKRLIEQVRTKYYRNDLTSDLPLNRLESLAITFENYQLAYTPELITDIYGTRVNEALMTEGKFTNNEGDNNWWIRSGSIQFIEGTETSIDAQNRFYLPISYTDPYGSKTRVRYGSYFLFIEETEDDLGNKTGIDLFNFRTLAPQRLKDINNNLSEAISDELGLVKAMAVFGKGSEADDLKGLSEITEQAEKSLISQFLNVPDTAEGVTDSETLIDKAKLLLKHATARFVYDFEAYKITGKPSLVATIIREEHYKKNNNSAVQLSFEYTNGLGKVVMYKVQAEPGPGKKVDVKSNNTLSISDIDTEALDPKQLRWIGNGRTVINNKGNAVKQYEPYFSVTHRYEDHKELVETGVTPVMYYDAMGRLIKTQSPDNTFSRTQFDSWKQIVYDANDTVLDSAWFYNRTNRLIDAELIKEGKDPAREKVAADKAARHANTPNVLYYDTFGRPVLSIDHNINIITEADEFYRTKLSLDTEGNLRAVTDARKLIENGNKGNLVMQYKYDMLGNMVYQNSMDAGQRWLLSNILGNPLRTWDERDHEFQYYYDKLHRPLQTKVLGGDGDTSLDHVFDRFFYGEAGPSPEQKNTRGKVIKHYDTSGLIETPVYDFKGQPTTITRKLFKNYKTVANWLNANLSGDLEAESYTFSTESDALGRVARQTAPDGSIIVPSYNEAGLLEKETVHHPGAAAPTVYIKDIDYNEKGQRNKIIYGNDVITRFYYDRETFRLKHLETKRKNSDPLQDWYYTFDPAGNITHIEDKNSPVIFFNNQKVAALSEYNYDALYRLVEAKGRENNTNITFNSKDNWNDAPYIHQLNPGDPISVRNYTQNYQYDEAGNIKQMRHQAAGNNWTRDYEYEKISNRLKTTQVGAETYNYTHHLKHGYITVMPHLESLGWNFKEELVKSTRQKVDPINGTAETTWYQYDGQGQRIRKLTENQAAPGTVPGMKEERIYIAGYEIYKKHSGTDAGLERISLSLMDDQHRFVIIETRNDVDDGTEKHLVRYQLHNHLGSASLELDGTAQVISYEEYHPYGTTAYQAKNAVIKSAAKRYRYTGMERDEETGLEYHSARYYLPWLGRWMSCDPFGLVDGLNLFCYSRNASIVVSDPEGTQPPDPRSFTSLQKFEASVQGPYSHEYLVQLWEEAQNPLFSLTQDDISILTENIELTAKPVGKGLRESIVKIDIDEPVPISRKGAWNDPANKQFMERFTNQQTKNAGIETGTSTPARPPISLAEAAKKGPEAFKRAANEMLTRPFSEVKELNQITEEARMAMRNLNRPDRVLADAINRSIRGRIAKAATPEAQLVNRALTEVGINPKTLSQMPRRIPYSGGMSEAALELGFYGIMIPMAAEAMMYYGIKLDEKLGISRWLYFNWFLPNLKEGAKLPTSDIDYMERLTGVPTTWSFGFY